MYVLGVKHTLNRVCIGMRKVIANYDLCFSLPVPEECSLSLMAGGDRVRRKAGIVAGEDLDPVAQAILGYVSREAFKIRRGQFLVKPLLQREIVQIAEPSGLNPLRMIIALPLPSIFSPGPRGGRLQQEQITKARRLPILPG
jgi:hypothetical protein